MRSTFLFMAALLLAACTHDPDELIVPPVVCDTSNVTWSSTIVPILQTHCAIADCHVTGGDGTGNFTTYAGVMTQVTNGKLANAVQHLPGAIPMPPSGIPIPQCDIEAMVAWINGGAEEN
jgi:hypothetical protein